jgi:uncharacterized protein YbjT (DUF2867 family)
MENRTAIVFGGTGLVGQALIEELLKSDNYKEIRVFLRTSVSLPDTSRIRSYLVDFDHPESFNEHITGDDLFICLGTTIKKAGSIYRMEQIDRDLPVTLAKKARENGVRHIAVVSSIGADKTSANYYLRIKGEMEQKIMDLDFETSVIVRPSLLLGDRKEKRRGENAGKYLMKLIGILLIGRFRKYRGIKGSDVARAMIYIIANHTGKVVFESDRLQMIADKN